MFLEHFWSYCGCSKVHIIPKKINVFIVLREAPPLNCQDLLKTRSEKISAEKVWTHLTLPVQTTRYKQDSKPGPLAWESGALTRRLKTAVSSISR